jgi:hypothetical protein
VVYSHAARDFHIKAGWRGQRFVISPTIPAGDLLLDLSDAEVR